MFSRLGLNAEQVLSLREDHGMYLVGDSRINIAGLAGKRHLPFAVSVAKVATVS
jgi:aromatic-amino-acid transaminase